jgi:hypothetical protein
MPFAVVVAQAPHDQRPIELDERERGVGPRLHADQLANALRLLDAIRRRAPRERDADASSAVTASARDISRCSSSGALCAFEWNDMVRIPQSVDASRQLAESAYEIEGERGTPI